MKRRFLCAIALLTAITISACYYPGTPAETKLYAPYCVLQADVPFADNLHTTQWDNVSLLDVDAYGRHYYADSDVDRSEKVTDTIYLQGNFSKTIEYIENLIEKTPEYNLLTSNCVQHSRNALQYSNSSFIYADSVIPNVAYLKVKFISFVRDVVSAIFH